VSASGRKNADDVLLAALASGQTIAKSAAMANVSERTARRRMKEPEFRQRLNEARAEMVEQVIGRLSSGMTKAVDTLKKLLRAKSEAVRLGAARSIVELGFTIRENVEFEQRLAALEEKANNEKPKLAS
jgi:hypothetical protein